MGNESSQFYNVDIDERILEGSEWTLYSSKNQFVSVFISSNNTPTFFNDNKLLLEIFSKNLMLFRHPCILKYISSWYKNSNFHLIVEEILPLTCCLTTQSPLQKCIGLYSVLKALCFLHDKGGVSHNNLSIASIYVTKDGNWKLGGMEFCCKFEDLSIDYLKKIEPYNLSNADPIADIIIKKGNMYKYCIDAYAFGKIVCELLSNIKDEELSHLSSFRELCEIKLQSEDLSERPKLSSLLDHPFFKNDFVTVYCSLQELPLQSNEQKTALFSTLSEKLKQFDESLVAKQLGGLLLSRLVFLDETAQEKFLPLILHPREDDNDEGLFSTEAFTEHLIPKLLQIFCVRDSQIRLSLLKHFNYFMKCFSRDELQYQILPELLVGIKDINNQLVSATLKVLGDLVMVLGAEIVIGGKRAKLFNNGKPNLKSTNSLSPTIVNDNLPLSMVVESRKFSNSESTSNFQSVFDSLQERPRPDGEEKDLTSQDQKTSSSNENFNSWDDWNQGNANEPNQEITRTNTDKDVHESEQEQTASNLNEKLEKHHQNDVRVLNTTMPDIFHLDIKNQVANANLGEMNFFEGMEPVINASNKLIISEPISLINGDKLAPKLDFSVKIDNDSTIGWEEDGWSEL